MKIQKKVRIASYEFSHLWADHLAGSLVLVWVFAPALGLCPRVGVGGVTRRLIDEFRRAV